MTWCTNPAFTLEPEHVMTAVVRTRLPPIRNCQFCCFLCPSSLNLHQLQSLDRDTARGFSVQL